MTSPWWTSVTETVRVTHKPTGTGGEGATREDAMRDLAEKLVQTGEISVNDARRGIGLKPFRPGIIPASQAVNAVTAP